MILLPKNLFWVTWTLFSNPVTNKAIQTHPVSHPRLGVLIDYRMDP